MFDFLAIKKTAVDAATRLQELQAEAQALRNQIAAVESAPAPTAEVQAAVESWIDQMSEGFTATFRAGLYNIGKHPRELNPRNVSRQLRLVGEYASRDAGWPGHTAEDPASSSRRELDAALCGLFPEHVKRKLALICKERTEGGLPAAERLAEVARLREQLRKVTAEETSLRAQAQEAGLKI